MEFCHNVQPFMQPNPNRNPGGDCFACSMTALLQHLFPKEGITFDECWDAFLRETSTGGKGLSNCWWTWHDALYAIEKASGQIDHQTWGWTPIPNFERWSHSDGYPVQSQDWFFQIESFIRSGWIAQTPMRLHPQPPVMEHYRTAGTDHMALIDGVRENWVPNLRVEGAHDLLQEVHVVCSSKGGYWIDAQKLLWLHGVNAVHLHRRREAR